MSIQQVLINFLSTDSPVAIFKTTPNITLDFAAKIIVQNKISMVELNLTGVASDSSGLFSISIPDLTTAMKITTSLSVGYYPTDSAWEFDLDIDLFELTQVIKICNKLTIDTSGLDHAPLTLGEDRIFGHQLGPHRSSRAVAMVHVAMFEALLFVVGGYRSYTDLVVPVILPNETCRRAAIIQACYDMLIYLFPSHQPRLLVIKDDLLDSLPDGYKLAGVTVGTLAAESVKLIRVGDLADRPELQVGIDYPLLTKVGEWRPDPTGTNTTALGARWGEVTPFVVPTSSTFRVKPLPSLSKLTYGTAFNEVKCLGGDGIITRTTRSRLETETGLFWAYDGTPSLCAPPRLYNQLAEVVSYGQHTTGTELLRLLTLFNVTMADTAITCWESKWFYKFWRPITGIREAARGTGPTRKGDRNPLNIGDVNWTPYGAPASNLSGDKNFTPPFPAYPSGHASFGGAIFQILRRHYNTDNITFTFVSDEMNGFTRDYQGNTRTNKPRTYHNLSHPEEENGQSRIYLGIHWSFDKTEGIKQGNQVADYIFDHLYQPIVD